MTEAIDTLITHAHLFTMQGAGVGYVQDGAVAVCGGQVVATGPTDTLVARYVPAKTLDATGHAVLPGLIDAHMHSPEALLRGVAQDVDHWMQAALAPYEKHLGPQEVMAGVRLQIIEGLKAGTTTFVDYTTPVRGLGGVLQPAGRARPPDAQGQRAAAGRHGGLADRGALSL